MDNAFVFEEGIGGVCSSQDYPYAGHRHWFKGCQKKKCENVNGTDITGFVNVTKTDAGLVEALDVQPISVAIDAQPVRFSAVSREPAFPCMLAFIP
jgi:hypothetical protein